MRSLSELHRDIATPLNNLEVNRLNDLQVSISELTNALSNRDQQFRADEIAQARMRLAVVALRLSQKTIPALVEIADDLLQTSGTDAIRKACNPVRNYNNDRDIPSEFTVPSEFGGIVSRATAAVRGLAGK